MWLINVFGVIMLMGLSQIEAETNGSTLLNIGGNESTTNAGTTLKTGTKMTAILGSNGTNSSVDLAATGVSDNANQSSTVQTIDMSLLVKYVQLNESNMDALLSNLTTAKNKSTFESVARSTELRDSLIRSSAPSAFDRHLFIVRHLCSLVLLAILF